MRIDRIAPSGGLHDGPLDGALSSAWLSHIYDALDWLAARPWAGDTDELIRIERQIEALAAWLRAPGTGASNMYGLPTTLTESITLSGQMAFRVLRLAPGVVVRLDDALLIGV